MTSESQIHSHPRPNYGAVFLSLFVLTVLEIIAANLPMAKISIVLLLVSLAITKATLVAMFYMHLRFEKWLLWLIAFGPLLLSLILTLTIASDIGHSH